MAEEHNPSLENGSMFKREHSDDTSKQGQDFSLTNVQLVGGVASNQCTINYTVQGWLQLRPDHRKLATQSPGHEVPLLY